MIPSRYNTAWTREELTLALYLYCQIPFAKTKANNPEVVRLAALLDRTPGSVARKLGNFGAFDPLLSQSGITGLTHTSKADRDIWNEFRHDWNALVAESQRLLVELQAPEALAEAEDTSSVAETPVIARPTGPTERQVITIARIGQAFFRRAVLASYEYGCCVCAIDLKPLLVGSHIIPWSVNAEQRTNPQNGLCLCVLHDKAFDRGLLTINTENEICIAASVALSRSDFAQTALQNFAGCKIRLPRRFAPDPECLNWHRKHVFDG